MSSDWHGEDTDTDRITPEDFDVMAIVLEGRHGTWAAQIADFFAQVHARIGDTDRSQAWRGVAETVRQREIARTSEP